MTNTENLFLVTACADHGTRECEWDSGKHYVALVREWEGVEHTDAETSPWWCCERMVVDPYGVYDH